AGRGMEDIEIINEHTSTLASPHRAVFRPGDRLVINPDREGDPPIAFRIPFPRAEESSVAYPGDTHFSPASSLSSASGPAAAPISDERIDAVQHFGEPLVRRLQDACRSLMAGNVDEVIVGRGSGENTPDHSVFLSLG